MNPTLCFACFNHSSCSNLEAYDSCFDGRNEGEVPSTIWFVRFHHNMVSYIRLILLKTLTLHQT